MQTTQRSVTENICSFEYATLAGNRPVPTNLIKKLRILFNIDVLHIYPSQAVGSLHSCTSHCHTARIGCDAGHTNERNFVGLSVNCNGYIACGSESNEVFTYYHRLPLPLTSHSFAMKGGRRLDADLEGRQFVSTVCWSHKGSNLLAANSAGVIKVMNLTTQ